ncbi:hopanoid biosynthesis-associated protein HpnK [Geomonas sp. RF6]|uniref:hopanoid biosynthesis-associated protein HpnK n=1 Tax=Geomonas sp. RF6 TaxID=2897342 RepID=UPI001E484C95|nr:hopanoid biosynthesis-associated protein HpnK [Geomonas sp. RF6]UFS68665.1 hopanoid biosynthesis-associated protein HpnK [Geomonas sp. RF6]
MKEIIFNADDFGLSSGANRGIIKAWREGVLTSTSLMPGGAAFDEAVALAAANPGLQVGVHITLVQGRSVLQHPGSPSLAPGGDFGNNPVREGMRYFFLKSLRPQLEAEIEAQIRKCVDAGIRLTHVDGHLNIHMHPTVFDILTELMPKYGISTFRLSRENLAAELSVARNRVVGKYADAFIFSRLADRCRTALDRLGIRYAGEVKGLLNSGKMTEEYLLKALGTVREELTEIYFHPGCRPCGELDRWMPEYRHDDEVAALTSPAVRRRMAELGLRLRNYRGEEKTYA